MGLLRAGVLGLGAALIAVLAAALLFADDGHTGPGPSRPHVAVIALVAKDAGDLPGGATAIATVTAEARLTSGPASTGYETIATLPKGATVYPLATYVEFVKVATTAGHQGYVPKRATSALNSTLVELQPRDVPLLNVDVVPDFFHPRAALGPNDQVTLSGPGGAPLATLGHPRDLRGGFTVSFSIVTRGEGDGVFKLTDRPFHQPGDGFPWWEGIRMLDVGTRGGSMFLRVRDGLGAERARRIDLGVPEQRITLVFQDAQGRGVTVLDAGGRVIRTVDVSSLAGVSLPAGLFPDRRFQLGGATEQQGASLTIRDLSLQMVPTGVAPRWPALRDLGERRGIAIGALLDWWRLADERYFEAATREFSLVELAEFSLPAVWLAPGRYDLQLLDNLVDWSLRMGWQVAANHLVFGADDAIPAWLLEGTYTREDYIRILEEHVRTIASRYSGKVTYWHIANEAVSRSLGGGDFWAKKIGPDYIEMAFRWARAADPSGLLIFLDDENNSPRDARTTRIVDTMYNLVKDLKARGVPIDGVGMQNHLFLPWNSQVVPKKGDVVATMQRFASLGVFVYSAELDVVASALGADSELRLAAQASVYGDMAAACVESGVCKAFGTWGITDAHSWVTCMDPVPWCPMKLPTGDPLLFDREYRPKPAYWAVWRAFGGQ